MCKRSLILIMIIVSILTFTNCSARSNPNTGGNTSKVPTVTPPGVGVGTTKPPKQMGDPINNQIKKMTLDEKIGQMIISGVDGYTNNEHSASLINKYHVGGFILLGQNVQSTQQVVTLINSLKSTNINSGNKIPLFLGVDQEGGRIDRMPPGYLKLPTNKAIGEINNSDFSFKIGTILGKELTSFGYNMDFAPVLDINSNPKNPVIGDRSFGASYDVVSKLGIETMKGIESQNIISAVKHFPGHGDTSVDSHTGLPIVNNDLNRLKSFELHPFAQAINNGVDMIMVAHILFPKIDPNYPSSMSKTIINDLLRKNMGFNGVIITDDMTMGAITKHYNIGQAAVRSLMAGSTIILVCHEYNDETAVINALKSAALNGQIPLSTIDNNVYKILKLKEKYGISDKTAGTLNVESINNLIRSVLQSYVK